MIYKIREARGEKKTKMVLVVTEYSKKKNIKPFVFLLMFLGLKDSGGKLGSRPSC